MRRLPVRSGLAVPLFFGLLLVSLPRVTFGQAGPIVGTAPVRVQPANATPTTDTTFTVDLSVDLTAATGTGPSGLTPAALSAFRIPVAFDRTRLELVSIAAGQSPAFASFDATPVAAANGSGAAIIAATVTGTAPAGVVSVATLTFRATASGSASIAASISAVSLASAIQSSGATLFGPAPIPPQPGGGGVTVQSPPSLRLTLTAGPSPVTPNGQLIYSIQTENDGGAPATNTVIRATVPAGVTFVAATNGGVHDNGTIQWNPGTLDAAAFFDATFAVNVTAASGTSIVTAPATASATEVAPVSSTPVTISVSANAPVKPGMIVAATSYNYNMGRIYDVTSGSPVLFARLPSTWVGPLFFTPTGRLMAFSDAHDGSLYDISSGGDLTQAAPLLKKIGTSITGVARDAAGNLYVARQEANRRIRKISPAGAITELPPLFQYPASVVLSGNTLYVSEGPAGAVKAIDLTTNAVTTFASGFTASNHHFAGQLIRNGAGKMYVLWGNSGGTGVFDITAGGNFAAATPATGRNAFRIDVNQLAVDGGNNLFLSGNGSGAVWRAAYNATTGTYGATAVFANGVSDTESIAIYPVPNVPLLILGVTTSANPAVTSRQLVYTLTLENRGAVAASSGTLTAALPAGVTFVSASNSGALSGDVVTWTFPTIAAGSTATRTIIVNVTAAAGSTLPATPAAVSATGVATVEAQLPALPVVAPPDLRIEVTGAASVPLNSHITYTIRYRNAGGSASTNTVIANTLPANTTFVTSERGTFTTPNVNWSLGTVAAGASGTVTFVVRAGGPVPGTITNNNCRISADAHPAVTAAAVTTSVTAASPLVATVTPAPNPVVPGTQINTAVRYRNTSTTAATNVTVTFPIPPNATFLSANGGGTFDGTAVVWNIPSLAPSADVTVRASFRIPGPAGTKTMVDATMASAEWAPAQGVPALVDVRPYPAILGPGVVLSVMSYNEGSNIGRVTALTSPTAKSFFAHTNSTTGAADPWAGPLTVGINGHVYAATEALGGSIWDITAGGDLRSGSTPFARGVVINPGTLLTDSNGNLYLYSYGPNARVARITAEGDVTYIGPSFNGGGGLALDEAANALYVSEGGTGTVKRIDIATGTTTVHASGFPPLAHHFSGQMVRTPTGRMFMLWGAETANIGLWEVTNAGSYAGVPRTSAPSFSMRLDINQVALAPNGDLYIAGNGRNNIIRAVWSNNTFGPMTPWATSTGGNLGDNEGLALFPPYALTIAGSASVSHGMRDDPLTFTLTYTNASGYAVDNTLIEVPLPAGFTLSSVSTGGTIAGNVARWSLGLVPAGGSGTVSIAGQITGLEGSTISLSGYKITADGRAAATGPAVNVRVDFPLGVEAIATPEPVTAGQPIEYTIRFENLNTTAATNAVVRSAIPAGTTFLSASSGGTVSGSTVTWNAGTLAGGAAGEVSFTVRADLPPAVVNDGTSIQSPEFGLRSGTPVVTTVLPLPFDLRISGTASPDPVTSGEELTYTIQYANTGGSTAPATMLRSEIPPGTSFVRASGGTLQGNDVVWPLGALVRGASDSVTFTVEVTAAAGATITNDSYSIASGEQTRNGAALTTAVAAPPPPPPLAVIMTAEPDPVTRGELLTYGITVSNPDDEPAENVVVTSALPSGATFVSTTGGGTATDSGVQWTLGTLASGASSTLTITVRVTTTGSTVLNPGATALSTGRAAASSGAVTTPVIAPPATLRLSIDAPESVTPATHIAYTLTFGNDGPGPVTSAVLADPLPAGTAVVSISHGGTLSGGIVTWPLGTLTAGQSGTRTLVVAPSQPPGSTVANSGATLAGNGAAPADGGVAITAVVPLPLVVDGALSLTPVEVTPPAPVQQLGAFTYASGGYGTLEGLTATLTTTTGDGAVLATHSATRTVTAGTTANTAFTWDTIGVASGTYTVTYNVIDPLGNELLSRTGTVVVRARDGANLTGTIAPVSSPVHHGAPLVARVTLANRNGVAYDALPIEILVADPGTLEPLLTVPASVAIGANGDAAIDVPVPTQALPLGDYPLWLTTPLGGGRLLATSTFTVIPPQLTLEPAAITIGAGTTGTLTARLSSPAAVPVTVTLTSSDPAVASVPSTISIAAGSDSQSVPVRGVSIGGPVTITATLPATLGGGSATSTVLVVLSGTLTATLQVYQGENVTFGITITNAGATPLTNAPFTIEIRDPNSNNTIDVIPLTVSIAAGGTFQTTVTRDTSPLAFQKYRAVLLYAAPVPPQTIATAEFEVLKPPPLRLEAMIGTTARVLIWANCSPGNSGRPCTPVPPPFLVQTLQTARIPYVVSGEENDFLARLRTGGFTAAIIDQAGAAEPKIAPELLATIHARTGLLFIHSAPNAMPKLAPALGTEFRGNLNGPASLQLLQTPFTSPAALTLNGNGTRIALAGAKAAATMAGSDTPVISYNEYGRGRAVIVPFDLELTPTLDVARLILASVGWISRPAEAPFDAREVAPLRVTVITPPGGDLPVNVTITLPSGMGVVDAAPPLASNNPLQWSATIPGNTTAAFDLWARLPDAAGTYSVTASASLPGGPPIVTRSVDVAVTGDAAALASSLRSELTALRTAARANPDVRALDDALALLAQIGASSDAPANIDRVLRILESLARVSLDTGPARAAAGPLLTYWQTKAGV